ncbi:pantetheine-phosphate adenylyltransferase [Corynebacterium jeikeium]|jgi:pantetheine-phosphate adenylyltransferase|uniref:Phosphopantetheine adenylyltransferase n=1 Tax=Corynebacterium jeikeium (strain K411) TaxID=306537 RepID=Q4JUY4_CORJK|nr:pantetheine-phosphate adenylyltransferase [Corynebacterium jeikeium]EEW16127.1 pantetheine-phosphate adenylyltransferase [Corynebacterium jeikeium ATCC 43734]OOD34419.1 pantetheine-phosphate adenylyltransferase [Corynebacterium jeikeium]WCZ53758.1 Phosphopantetheine adenylyltransferase [Corynebacterium jeikeium]CAI37373.1 pantetheine-phosphate adenylyltransferase [Corynebacterium jeikeium K411]SCX17407.1 Phosphopantetheine adenylyltransferase [Corynebacterium jeikeium]
MRVVCPGSFDPITLGHLDIFTRAAANWEEVVVLVTYNPNKNGLFTAEERVELIEKSIAAIPNGPKNITVDTWDKLLVDYLNENNIQAMVKGLRSSLDYEYELPMAQMNQRLSGAETYFLLTSPEYGYVSSTLCKEVAKYGGDVSGLLPEPVVAAVEEKFRG